MGRDDHAHKKTPNLLMSPREFFLSIVSEACKERKVQTFPLTQTYIVNLLEHYLNVENFVEEIDSETGRRSDTLAEMYLRAANAEPQLRVGLLKRLADKSLYISGFFSQSLSRKLVDVDYYANMGGAAYASLADSAREDLQAQVFTELATRFMEFADVLSYISSRSQAQSEANIMRLYETYARTGSQYAREQLLEKGLLAVPQDTISRKKQ